jgi:hypothetical protein
LTGPSLNSRGRHDTGEGEEGEVDGDAGEGEGEVGGESLGERWEVARVRSCSSGYPRAPGVAPVVVGEEPMVTGCNRLLTVTQDFYFQATGWRHISRLQNG